MCIFVSLLFWVVLTWWRREREKNSLKHISIERSTGIPATPFQTYQIFMHILLYSNICFKYDMLVDLSVCLFIYLNFLFIFHLAYSSHKWSLKASQLFMVLAWIHSLDRILSLCVTSLRLSWCVALTSLKHVNFSSANHLKKRKKNKHNLK